MNSKPLIKDPNAPDLRSDYDSIIVSYSNGIDSTGALYWALQHFDKEKIWLIYNDTGLEYSINVELFYRTAKVVGIPKNQRIILARPGGFMEILENRQMFPDSKNRWCTSYLKTDITDKWIRHNRHLLGTKCLYVTGERRDESPRRSRMNEITYHRTHLKTTRVADFTCHHIRPVLDYRKGKMFEWSNVLGLDPHPCYEYVNRCSCIACIFMPDKHAIENMKRHPEKFRKLIQKEIEYQHTWKKDQSLEELWNQHCEEGVSLDIVV